MVCRFRYSLLLLATLLVLQTGCADKYPKLGIQPGEEIVLSTTPFYPQDEYQCGPASLAMLLGASGKEVRPEALAPITYLPNRKGSLQLDLIGASRKYNRIPYEIKPEISAILAELKNGHPVLVLQNYGLEALPAYHYAVVIGARSDTVILRSGTTETLYMDTARFLMSWVRAGAWGIILLKPGELPAGLEIGRYVAAVNGYEMTGDPKLAEASYEAALSSYPEAHSLLFALGNNYLQQGRLKKAETQFRSILKTDAHNIAAANNLAEVLGKQGHRSAALAIIKQVVKNAAEQNSPLLPFVKKTYRELNTPEEALDSASNHISSDTQ